MTIPQIVARVRQAKGTATYSSGRVSLPNKTKKTTEVFPAAAPALRDAGVTFRWTHSPGGDTTTIYLMA